MPTLANNKHALFNYTLLEEFEAGIILSGQEVKAAKLGQINLKGSYVSIEGEEAWLKNCHISRYKLAGPDSSYDPTRKRKLLLNKKEIQKLSFKVKNEGLTIVPTSIYTKGTLLKVKIALSRGKKKFDKRELIKKRETDRKISRMIKLRG